MDFTKEIIYENISWDISLEELKKHYNDIEKIENDDFSYNVFNEYLLNEFYKNGEKNYPLKINGNIEIFSDKRISYNEYENGFYSNINLNDESYGKYRFFLFHNNKLFKIIVLYIYDYRQKLTLEKFYGILRRKYGRFNTRKRNYFSNNLWIEFSGVIDSPKNFNGYSIYVSYYNPETEEKLLNIDL